MTPYYEKEHFVPVVDILETSTEKLLEVSLNQNKEHL